MKTAAASRSSSRANGSVSPSAKSATCSRPSARGCAKNDKLPISRKKCVEQIKLLDHQRRDLEMALAELRQIYTDMLITSNISRAAGETGPETLLKPA